MKHFSLVDLTISVSEKNEGDLRSLENILAVAPTINDLHALQHLKLTHGSDVVVAVPTPENREHSGDAILANKDYLALSMVVGDCLPIVLYDSKSGVTALIHGGWRSLHANILEKTVQKAQQELGLHTATTQAWIGPGIRACCYSTSVVPTQHTDQDWKAHIEHEENCWTVDLAGFVRVQLQRLGVKNIDDTKICTSCGTGYFSHHRAMQTNEADGRFAVVVKAHT